jgi:CRP-like cAMP-binding protein
VLQASTLRQVNAGQSLSFAGDEDGYVRGIIAGQVDFTSGVSAVDAPITDIALPGDWWGFRPLRGVPRAIHAVARTDLLLAELPLRNLSAMLQSNPGWWQQIAIIIAMKEERWGSGMVDLTIRDSRLRCVAVLLRLANCRHAAADVAPVTIHFTQEQLAAAANLSRFPTGTVLRDLARAGLVRLGYGTITVLGAARLCRMVNDT